jgi:hypothetical protein
MTFTTSQKSEQIWEEARALAEFHAEDLVKFGVHISTARYYVNRWEQLGRIRLVRRDARNRRYFCNVEHPVNPLEPVDGPATPEGNMWRAMRLLPQFSPTDLAAHANVGEVAVTVDDASRYCRILTAAGYLRARQTHIPGTREPLYQLIENTGPRAPRPARLQGLLDPNLNKFHPSDDRIKT